jgi:hypothetical protein
MESVWEERRIYRGKVKVTERSFGGVDFPLLCKKLGPYSISGNYFSSHNAFNVTAAAGAFPLMSRLTPASGKEFLYIVLLAGDLGIMGGTVAIDLSKTAGIVGFDTALTGGAFAIDCVIGLFQAAIPREVTEREVSSGEFIQGRDEKSRQWPMKDFSGYSVRTDHSEIKPQALDTEGCARIEIENLGLLVKPGSEISLSIYTCDSRNRQLASETISIDASKLPQYPPVPGR